MKRFFCALSLLLSVLTVSLPSWAAKAPAGKILLVKGQVLIQEGAKVVADTDGKRERKVESGAPFYVGETLVTKADGRVKIQFIELGNEVVLGANTSLLIEKASTEPGKRGTSLDLARGEVRASVKPNMYSGQGADKFEVKTQNAVAGVRGTIFVARFDARTQKAEFATERGKVFVSAAGGGPGVLVEPGRFTVANVGSTPAAPKPLSANPELAAAVSDLGGSPAPGSGAGGGEGALNSPDSKGSDSKSESGDGNSAKSDSGTQEGQGQEPGKSPDKQEKKSESANRSAENDNSKKEGSGDGRAPASSGESKSLDSMTDKGKSKGGDEGAPPPAALGREPVVEKNRGPASVGGPTPGTPAVGGLMRSDLDVKPVGPGAIPPGPPPIINRAINNFTSAQNQSAQTAYQGTIQTNQMGTVVIPIPPK